MNYSEMTDFEINLSVFESLFGKMGDDRNMLRVWQQGKFQPCNSWADAGPIIQSNLIDLEALYDFTDDTEHEIEPTGVWAARGVTKFFEHPRSESANPLRAAMIVFLMMQESK